MRLTLRAVRCAFTNTLKRCLGSRPFHRLLAAVPAYAPLNPGPHSMPQDSDANPRPIALSWLAKFSKAVSAGDVAATTSTFLPHGWLRDVLTFTWTTRSLEGPSKIADYLTGKLKPGYITAVKHYDDQWVLPAFFPAGPHTGVEEAFSYETPVAHGRGFARLVQDASGEWKALSVCMYVTDLKGHEETDYELGIYGGHTLAWADVYAERRAKIETDPQVLIGTCDPEKIIGDRD